MTSETHTNAGVPTRTTRGRPRKGEEKIDLPKCWAMRFQKRMTYDQIADHFGCRKSAVARACRKLARLLPDPEEVAAFRETKGDMLEATQYQLMATMLNQAKLRKATLNQTAFAFSKVSEQLHLERGESTANHAIFTKIVMSANERLFHGKGGHPQGQEQG